MTAAAERRLRRALVRLLWNAVADNEQCACYPRDRCSLCYAMTALGLGRWKSADTAQGSLLKTGLQ